MTEKIRQWLANPNRKFEDGLKYYDQVKSDNKKDQFFRSAPTFRQGSIQFNIMCQELTRLLRIMDQKQNQQKPKPPEGLPAISLGQAKTKNLRRADSLKINDDSPDLKYSELPDEMKVKFDLIKDLHKQLGGLKLALETVTDDADRRTIADEICTKYDQRRDLWIELDTWWTEHGRATPPKKKKVEDMSLADLRKEIKLRNDNINRASKSKTPKNRAKTEKRILVWESEIVRLKQLLDSRNASTK